jgi:hypothetical protein
MSGDSQRFANVKIVNMVDGGTIEGHDGVQAHFEKEKKLLDDHGETITFQVYRPNLAATTAAELQGERVAELKVDAGFVGGGDSVTVVKAKLRDALRPTVPDVNLTDTASGRAARLRRRRARRDHRASAGSQGIATVLAVTGPAPRHRPASKQGRLPPVCGHTVASRPAAFPHEGRTRARRSRRSATLLRGPRWVGVLRRGAGRSAA